jgi:hypothetical protein
MRQPASVLKKVELSQEKIMSQLMSSLTTATVHTVLLPATQKLSKGAAATTRIGGAARDAEMEQSHRSHRTASHNSREERLPSPPHVENNMQHLMAVQTQILQGLAAAVAGF